MCPAETGKQDEAQDYLYKVAGLMRVWFMDKARFGLHPVMRQVLITQECRTELCLQRCYESDDLYGTLEVVLGEGNFFVFLKGMKT
jgi:hypothetical protein